MAHYFTQPCLHGTEWDVADDMTLMPFRLNETWLMVDAALVREVLGRQTTLTVPHQSRELPGLCAWRGRAIPVLDMAQVLGIDQGKPLDWERTLVVTAEDNTVAIPVTEARAVVRVESERRRPAHVTQHRFSGTEVDADGDVMAVIELASVVQHLVGRGGNERGRATAAG